MTTVTPDMSITVKDRDAADPVNQLREPSDLAMVCR